MEIEPETGNTEIVSYVACDDAGNIINHQIVEGQVQGGLTQGAGQVFSELAVYDDSGQLLTGSFMDYAMPRAGLVNGIKLLDHPVPTKLNPLGAKGVGEAGVTGSMPALMNAVLDALRQAGVKAFEMPATPARIWKALQESEVMRRSTERILTTHVGSLIRPAPLLPFIRAKQSGQPYDRAGLWPPVSDSVGEVVASRPWPASTSRATANSASRSAGRSTRSSA